MGKVFRQQGFPRELRVRRQADFDRVYGSKAFAADDVLVITAVENDLAVSRFGVSVSRKVGGAVLRNRWKRRLREAFRKSRRQLPAGYDFVARPRRGARPDYHAIADSLPRLARRATRRLRKGAP